ncbi:MAG: hypothetical protein HZA93_02630 [Verrucomicrobia bacterium]|nr:hypothetical protein [Verrucomicrobiota bacterium]
MKTSTHESPRFTCRLARGLLSTFGRTDAGEPRGPGSAHVATCESCQAFFATCDELDLALTRSAAREWSEPPANLEQNILRAVRLDGSRERQRVESAPPRLALWSLTGAVACAALALVALQDRFVPARPAAPAPVARATVQPAADAATSNDPAVLAKARELIASVSLFSEIRPRTAALLQQDPLQHEVDALKADARHAVRFLAMNFLPASADELTRGE